MEIVLWSTAVKRSGSWQFRWDGYWVGFVDLHTILGFPSKYFVIPVSAAWLHYMYWISIECHGLPLNSIDLIGFETTPGLQGIPTGDLVAWTEGAIKCCSRLPKTVIKLGNVERHRGLVWTNRCLYSFLLKASSFQFPLRTRKQSRQKIRWPWGWRLAWWWVSS